MVPNSLTNNINRKADVINTVKVIDNIPLFSFVELNVNEICNRVCPFCPRSEDYPNQNIHMDISIAKIVVDELSSLNFQGIVNISGTGEPLLTKHICDIVKLFSEKNIHIEIVTNGDKLSTKLINKLYTAGLSQLVVSMYDGPEQVEYFNKLFAKCNIATDLYTLRDRWYSEEEGYGLMYTNRAGSLKLKDKSVQLVPCYYPSYATYIDWNGDILLCCQDMYNRTIKFGNIQNKSLLEIWKNKKLIEYRQKLKEGNRCLSPCNNCNANGVVFGKNHANKW